MESEESCTSKPEIALPGNADKEKWNIAIELLKSNSRQYKKWNML
ncbi:hypothetical protein [Microcoleus sp. herbarium12]